MAPDNRIPRRALIAGSSLGPRMSAQKAGEAIARGLQEAGTEVPDLCVLPEDVHQGKELQELLVELGFDTRMRAARALVLTVESLREQTLAGSMVFELATRARQTGVPCYAVTGENHLDDFDLRIIDLQLVLEARTPSKLTAAGRRLAEVL